MNLSLNCPTGSTGGSCGEHKTNLVKVKISIWFSFDSSCYVTPPNQCAVWTWLDGSVWIALEHSTVTYTHTHTVMIEMFKKDPKR